MKQHILALACLCSAVVIISAIPLPAGEQELDVLQIPLANGKELDVLSLGAKDQEQLIAERNKRTIGLLRELFPDITKQIDGIVNRIIAQVIRVAGPSLLPTLLGNRSPTSRPSTFDTTFDDDDEDDEDDNEDVNDNNVNANDTNDNANTNISVKIDLPTILPDSSENDTENGSSSAKDISNESNNVSASMPTATTSTTATTDIVIYARQAPIPNITPNDPDPVLPSNVNEFDRKDIPSTTLNLPSPPTSTPMTVPPTTTATTTMTTTPTTTTTPVTEMTMTPSTVAPTDRTTAATPPLTTMMISNEIVEIDEQTTAKPITETPTTIEPIKVISTTFGMAFSEQPTTEIPTVGVVGVDASQITEIVDYLNRLLNSTNYFITSRDKSDTTTTTTTSTTTATITSTASTMYPTSLTSTPSSANTTTVKTTKLFPVDGATDTQIDLSAINKQLEETIRVARQVKEAEAAAQAVVATQQQQESQQKDNTAPLQQIPIPTREESIQLSFNNDILTNNVNSKSDQQISESKSPAIDELSLDSDEDTVDLDDRNKRFLTLGGGGFAGGSSGGSNSGTNSGTGSSSGGSGNFLFDIVRLFSGSVQTQTGDEAANSANSVSGSDSTGDSDTDSDANRAADGYTEGIPGPVTRLVVLANRGLANLIQDLILRVAATSEKFVNFKAKLITALI